MEQNPLIEIGLPLALVVIMTGMGLTLTSNEFRKVLVHPRALVIGTIAQMAVFPALAFGLAHLLELPPELAVGLVVLAACPAGATSNVFTFLARGHVALSITLTVASSVVAVVSVPLFASLAASHYLERDLDTPLRLPLAPTMGALFALIVVPVAVGMLIKARKPALARRAEGAIAAFGIAVLTAIVVALVWQTRADILSLLSKVGLAALALGLSGVGLGLLSMPAARLSRADGLTLAIEMAIKNAFLGLMVTLTLLGSHEMAIPAAVYGVLMYGLGAALTFVGRRALTASRS